MRSNNLCFAKTFAVAAVLQHSGKRNPVVGQLNHPWAPARSEKRKACWFHLHSDSHHEGTLLLKSAAVHESCWLHLHSDSHHELQDACAEIGPIFIYIIYIYIYVFLFLI